tara:strand:+ start:283 stop:651 length:369 start_codon:yes stop_codon:yes gene_type:complete
MSKIKLSIISFLLFFLFSFNCQALKFISGLEDIPVYKKMEHVEDSLILFDKIDGRYVSVEITGDYDEDKVLKFYKKILPNLGWKEKKPLIFNRNNETLEVISKKEKGQVFIKFNIFPLEINQ